VLSTRYVLDFSVGVAVVPPTDLTVTNGKVFPAIDKYLDTTEVTWTDAEEYARVDLRITDSLGNRVRQWNSVTSGVVWDGRRADGRQLPNGTYEFRVRSFDAVGNRAWSEPVPVRVSDKVLVTKTRSVTVTPEGSRVPEGGNVGRCSKWMVPSKHGWPGSASHLSNVRCVEDAAASEAWTVHETTLAKAVSYRRVQLSWYGGPTKGERCVRTDVECDRALATIYESDGDAVGWVHTLDYLTAQHVDYWARAADVVRDQRRVRWGLYVNGGNRYDVKSFTLRYKADVLVNPS
jgi:hypothetical protein